MTITYDDRLLTRPPVAAATDRDDEFRAPRDHVRFLRIPPHSFVMMDGQGPPNARAFEARMPGLYGVAYPLRFALKVRGIIGKVGPLEGLWWTTDSARGLDSILEGARGHWRWTLLIGLPDEATDTEIEQHLEAGRAHLASCDARSLHVATLDEGDVAQIMHIGPYAAERPTIERLHTAIAAAGLRPRGRHHELYLGDPRRCAPERLRTLVRQPVT